MTFKELMEIESGADNKFLDFDGVMYYLACSLGLMEHLNNFETFQKYKWVFWSDNGLNRMLYGIIMDLVKKGMLEQNSNDSLDGDFRWNKNFNIGDCVEFFPEER